MRLLLDHGAYPPPGCAIRRGVDRKLAEKIARLAECLSEDISDSQRRQAERRIRGCQSCQTKLAAKDAPAAFAIAETPPRR